MQFELTGKLILKEDTVDVSASFKKREFVIEIANERNSEWNDFVKFQLTQDKTALIDPVTLNSEIKVSFNIRGRKWEKDGKVSYFSSMECWKLEVVNTNSVQPQNEALPPSENPSSDLPF